MDKIMELYHKIMQIDSMTDEEYGNKYGVNRRVARAGVAAKLQEALEEEGLS